MTDGGTDTSGTERLKYLRNNELRQEIVFAVGGDPSEYDRDETYNLRKADLVRVVEAVADRENPQELTVRGLYDLLDESVPEMDHEHNAGNTWGIRREDLKAIHKTVDGRPPQKVVTDGGQVKNESGHPGWVCDGCGKHVTGAIPRNQCVDCGGRWFVATEDRLACDRCGHEDTSRVLNSDHNRLCNDCVDYENRENPECPECSRRMLPDGADQWECPDCWNHSLTPDTDQEAER
jgi:ribosomal protein S27AE